MNSYAFTGIDFSSTFVKYKKPSLSYWISGQYIVDAQGNRNYVITSIYVGEPRKAVILDL